ncbi:hypothetical protein ACVRXQ_05940 [Streptococcus panodentis]|uniref:Uncharacterized protein n=1 Tax=Streptococcus panodentis TaxID=1581472 RepID=A0ABS5AUS3_9STRE|nr:hypothetical protein [Streptococcus panodentis]MBP2620317.1 hypothetical protein [Streptococcus panodentis]
MEKIGINIVFRKAWELMLRYFFVWLGGLLVVFLPLFALGYSWSLSILGDFIFNIYSNYRAGWDSVTIAIPLIWAVGSSIIVPYINKFSLTMVRNPQAVRRNFWQAVWYSLSDGLLTRFLYTFLCFLPLVIALYAGLQNLTNELFWQEIFGNFEQIVGLLIFLSYLGPIIWVLSQLLYSYLFESHFFLLFYILQDTSSRDNRLAPLSFFGCLRKSVSLIGGYRVRYMWLSFLLKLLVFGANYVVVLLTLLFVKLLGAEALNAVQFLPLLFTAVFQLFDLIARAVFADALMAKDEEIVDFGD